MSKGEARSIDPVSVKRLQEGYVPPPPPRPDEDKGYVPPPPPPKPTHEVPTQPPQSPVPKQGSNSDEKG